MATHWSTRNSSPEVFFEKGVLKMYSKFVGEHPCRSVISIKLLATFMDWGQRQKKIISDNTHKGPFIKAKIQIKLKDNMF